MEIYALYGPSGTGKSTSALALAHKYRITAIIDDGLLIFQGKKVAGYSAKYEKTIVQAVKRAIFFYEDHAKEIKDALSSLPIERLLILGTSRKMINRIKESLNLPEIQKCINITEIRSSAEIKAALFDRGTQGRHVIPIPRIQVEQDFIHRLIAKVDKIFSPKKEEIGETTIVHPQFQTGKIHVSELVLKKLVIHGCSALPFIDDFWKIKTNTSQKPSVEMEVSLRITKEQNIPALAQQIQTAIYNSFLTHLELELAQIRIQISHVSLLPTSQSTPAAPHLALQNS